MSGYSVNRYTIGSRKIHKSDQKGHLTLKYRRNNVSEGENASSSIERDAKGRDEDFQKELEGNQEGGTPGSNSESGKDETEGLEIQEGSEEEADDDEELLKELEKIRMERAEMKRKKKNSEIRLMLQNNPLLDDSLERRESKGGDSDGEGYVLRKRWTEDTVFRNQNKVNPGKKRFINDILHSDQHKEFMRKYIL
ncbi:putative Pre-mRNA-splicing factor CWC15 [Cryptosporidium felis]|nr:putative Pre-mRNA-splicing factor CWC15 [Cryptosporidium felis]